MTESRKVQPVSIQTSFTSGQSESIDFDIIEMLKRLSLPEKVSSFEEAIELFSERLGLSLKSAQSSVFRQDKESLEQAALEVSQNALKIGAINILKYSYQLQNVARTNDYQHAKEIIQSLELEYCRVRQDLANIV